MLARRLIVNQVTDEQKVEEVISFLTSESGSHDYTISRREGRDLGLHVESPDDGLYSTIKTLYDDFRSELRLNQAFDREAYLGQNQSKQYQIKRVLAESLNGGSDYFLSEGTLSRVTVNTAAGPQPGLNDARNFEGWRREQ